MPEEQTASKALASVSKVNSPHSSLSPPHTWPLLYITGDLILAIVLGTDFLLSEE